MNTLMCRSVHELMVKHRPEVHCSHIGPTGGGQCDDSTTYVERVVEALDQMLSSSYVASANTLRFCTTHCLAITHR